MTDDTEVVKPRTRKLAFGLFVLLEAVNLLPILAMCRSGGGSDRNDWQDAGYRNTFRSAASHRP